MTRASTAVVPFSKQQKKRRRNDAPSAEEKRIGEILSYRRPHDSDGELEFIMRFIMPLKPKLIEETIRVQGEEMKDVHAFIVTIPHADGSAIKRAFCAHTDSVHNRTISDKRQSIGFDAERHEFYVNNPKQRDCLGADDGAGCYVLFRLIEAKIPGMYVFFRGEERGGIGSTYVSEKRADLFTGIEYAIQFDRRGTHSIITEMMCGMTCSDEFGTALAEALGMGHKLDPTGTFTDTANLAEIVPECTNISVGYESEHSAAETLDTGYLLDLVDHCIQAFSASGLELPIKRMPADYGVRQLPGDGFWSQYGAGSRTASSAASSSYKSEFGMEVGAFDLPELSLKELEFLVSCMSNVEVAELLHEAGKAIGEAYMLDFEKTH
jgi:hypothetical protein